MRSIFEVIRRGRLPMVARACLLTLVAGLLAVPAARAFPPAPHHLIFGIVRDELGNPLTMLNAEIILEAESGVKIRTALVPGLRSGVNYQLQIPMDAGLTLDRYQPSALRPTLGFRLRVRIGNADYLPIEMRGDFSKLGQPAGRTRIDLTLGEDSDGDGLPDAWERALIAASAGKYNGLADINANDDSDGDGLSNLKEYVAGTYAFDPKDGFVLSLISADGAAATLDFLAIRGRSYSIQGTSDLQTWQPLSFVVVSPGTETESRTRYQASEVQPIRVRVPPEAGALRFFRLMVE